MFKLLQRPVKSSFAACAVAVLALALVGCSSFDSASGRIASIVTPYQIDVVQGNFVSKEQVAVLQPGMGKNQVRDILGTPLLTSLFHADRWDYVFTFKRQRAEPQARRVTVFFKGENLERFEADELPTEAEFVATLDSGRPSGKVPNLQASDESLAKFAPVAKPQTSAILPPLAQNYPPLEPVSR
jgi:outer membrane protein assembly factor BamE